MQTGEPVALASKQDMLAARVVLGFALFNLFLLLFALAVNVALVYFG